jgi:hypothetical protein
MSYYLFCKIFSSEVVEHNRLNIPFLTVKMLKHLTQEENNPINIALLIFVPQVCFSCVGCQM